MAKVTKDMIIMDVLSIDPGTAPFLLEIGMHCLAARRQAANPEEACAVTVRTRTCL